MTEPPIHFQGTVGGDYVAANKTVSQWAGGDLVGRDQYKVEAPPVGIAALHQLPPAPADFTGRAAELAELRAAVHEQGAALCGLRGLGGVGKTALALVLAHVLAADYPDAQIFLDLQGVAQPLTPEAAMAHVIRAYRPVEKLPDEAGQLAAVYRSVLAGQRALLLFDNARDADQIKPLIPPPGCLLLVTSRQKFALPGLKAVNLDSLPPAEAAALLLKLAPRIGGQAARLAELCGYLPLALTLAGSALAEREDLEPETYAGRLDQTRLTVLDEVAASLALSDGLLAPEQQRWWHRLSVFPAGFDAPAAAAVWALAPDPAANLLSDLLRLSLLEFNTATRRYRLHDLARDFVRSHLSDTERRDAQQRHALHYKDVLAVADKLYLKGGENILLGLALFDLERLNILAGQAWAAAQAEQDEAAAQLASDYPDAGAFVLYLRQHTREKIAWPEAGLAAARHLKDRRLEGAHLANLGIEYANLGELRRAIDYHEQALAIFREIGDRRGEGSVLGNLGNAYANLGEPRRAIEHHEQALVIDREIGDRRGEGNDLGNLGIAYANLGDARRGIEYYEQQLSITREIGDRRGEGNALGNLGIAYADLGKPRRAIEYYEQRLVITREIGDRRGEGGTLGSVGNAYANLGEPHRAIEYYEQALEIEREIGDLRGIGNTLGNLGVVYAGLDQSRRAIEFYEQQLFITREIGDRQGESTASWNLGNAYARQGDLARAVTLMQFTVDYERGLGHADAEADAAQVDALRKRLADRPASGP